MGALVCETHRVAMVIAVAGVVWGGLCQAGAVTPAKNEFAQMRQWVSVHLGAGEGVPPFSFTCDGHPFSCASENKAATEESSQQHTESTERLVTWTAPASGLEVRCQTVVYADYPAVEWVAYLRNAGQKDSPLIENIDALNAALPCDATGPVTVYHGRGSNADYSDFALLSDTIPPGGRLNLGSHGRPGNRVG
ncbi:MAG: hypothetical protein NTU83_05660, partial [Candidatus Hydrogenedentes bacterium]|nr:hypothetical protein [Candidatus Hydrogenedentota bacterium]